jgi:hypothetical protein
MSEPFVRFVAAVILYDMPGDEKAAPLASRIARSRNLPLAPLRTVAFTIASKAPE